MSWDCTRFNFLNQYHIQTFANLKHKRGSLIEDYCLERWGDVPLVLKPTMEYVNKLVKAGPQQYIGVEIELEKVKTTANPSLELQYQQALFWNAVADGSLRDNGAEYVTYLGASVQNADVVLGSLEQYIKIATEGRVEANARTGLHVHFNVSNMSLRELSNILFLYAVLEPVFFEVSGNRCENIFCVPWHANRRTLGRVITELVESAERGIYNNHWRWRNYSKYCALNLAPLGTYGTLEFRMHEGTFDALRIKRWIDTINNLFILAKKTDIASNYLKFRSDRTNEKYYELFDQVFNLYPIVFINAPAYVKQCREATIQTIKGFVDYGHLPVNVQLNNLVNVAKPPKQRNVLRNPDEEDFAEERLREILNNRRDEAIRRIEIPHIEEVLQRPADFYIGAGGNNAFAARWVRDDALDAIRFDDVGDRVGDEPEEQEPQEREERNQF